MSLVVVAPEKVAELGWRAALLPALPEPVSELVRAQAALQALVQAREVPRAFAPR
jgi:hypothetical protein